MDQRFIKDAGKGSILSEIKSMLSERDKQHTEFWVRGKSGVSLSNKSTHCCPSTQFGEKIEAMPWEILLNRKIESQHESRGSHEQMPIHTTLFQCINFVVSDFSEARIVRWLLLTQPVIDN